MEYQTRDNVIAHIKRTFGKGDKIVAFKVTAKTKHSTHITRFGNIAVQKIDPDTEFVEVGDIT